MSGFPEPASHEPADSSDPVEGVESAESREPADEPEPVGRDAVAAPRPAALVPRPLPPVPRPLDGLPVGLVRLGRRARELAQNPVAVAAASAAATVATSVAVGVVRRALGDSAGSVASVAPAPHEVLLRGVVRHEVHVVHHVVRTVHIVQTVQRTSLPGGPPFPPMG